MTDDASTASSNGTAEPTTDTGGGMNLIELTAALLLGVAAILTAYAAYNGALAGGEALKGFTQSSRTTADANGFYNDYSQTYSADQAIFLQYQILIEHGDNDTAAVVKDNLFSEPLTIATDAWNEIPQEADGPATPLDMDEYIVEAFTTATDLTNQADAEFDAAQAIGDKGDNFDLAAVYLAVSLFFAGIAALFKVRRIQVAMLTGSTLLLIPGVLAISRGKGWM